MRIKPQLSRRTLHAVLAVTVGLAAASAASVLLGRAPEERQATTIGVAVSPVDVDAAVGTVPLHDTPLHGAVGDPGLSGARGPSALASPSPIGASSAADPHRLGHPRTSRGDIGPPDSTPRAAAAGTEPGEMTPALPLPPGWGYSVHRFNVASMTRSYLMVRAAPVRGVLLPVVVVLHGRNETPAIIESVTHAPQLTGPAILVFPAGYGRSWDAGGCCGVAHRTSVDDVSFLTQTIRRVLASQRDANRSRVSMVGFSNGGRMAYRMACDVPGMFAGVAAVEAVPVEHCASTTPVPIMIVASAGDPLLTIRNGSRLKTMQGYVEPTVQSTVANWRHLDGCVAGGVQAASGAATVDIWSHCRPGARVAYALYDRGGHRWPQPTAPTESRAGTPSAGALIWGWLHREVVIAEPPS